MQMKLFVIVTSAHLVSYRRAAFLHWPVAGLVAVVVAAVVVETDQLDDVAAHTS